MLKYSFVLVFHNVCILDILYSIWPLPLCFYINVVCLLVENATCHLKSVDKRNSPSLYFESKKSQTLRQKCFFFTILTITSFNFYFWNGWDC